ncbi:hypothetical protein HHI36_008087, partial [Cryptolaemus montrouzieri]
FQFYKNEIPTNPNVDINHSTTTTSTSKTFEFEELYNVETQNDDFNEHFEELPDENLYDENLYDENDETDENFRSTASESQQK